jgi:hypothetical protein
LAAPLNRGLINRPQARYYGWIEPEPAARSRNIRPRFSRVETAFG